MKRDHPSPPSCEGCGRREFALFLFNIYFQGKLQLHCTNCVLSGHRGLFCPICFQVYQKPPLPHLRFTCSKCTAVAHRSCVISASSSASLSRAFQCPACDDPAFDYFSVRIATRNKNNGRTPSEMGDRDKPGGGRESVTVSAENGENGRCIDGGMAKVLVAAAQIAATKMSGVAKEARERASELALVATKARKEAKEKLELAFALEARESESTGVDPHTRYVNNGTTVVAEANNGNHNWNQTRTGRSELPISGGGRDRRSNHVKDGGKGHR